jgi:tetratricopeptide (TPR) repeat protein
MLNAPQETLAMRWIITALLVVLATPPPAESGTSRDAQLFQSGDCAKAKAEFSAEVRRNDLDARAHFYLGRLALVEGDLDAAIEQLKRAVDLQDSESDYHLWYGKAVTRKGLAVRSKDTTAVEREMNAAIAIAPDTIPAYSALASWYVSQQEWRRAFATFDRYLQRRPDDPYGLYGIGRVAATSGQELELDPRNEEARKAMK